MARYTITYKCGHTEEVQLFGKYADRERKIAWYATIDCPHCEAEAAKQIAEETGLVALKGSDKQVAWANDIRNNTLKNIEQLKASAKQSEIIAAMVEELLANDSAHYWIENRDELAGNFRTFSVYMVQTYGMKYIKK